MLVDKKYSIKVGRRNKNKINSVLSYTAKVGDILFLDALDIKQIGTTTIYLDFICDSCGEEYQLTACRAKVGKNDNYHLFCGACRSKIASEKMVITNRSPEYRLRRSEEKKAFYQTDYGKVVHEKQINGARQKFMENYEENSKIAASYLPHPTGEAHPNWNPNKSEYKIYRNLVGQYTDLEDLTTLNGHEKRGMAGKDGAYHLDHIVSIKYGFDNNIPPGIVGSIHNLRFIPWEENYKKRARSDMPIGLLMAIILTQ